MEPSFEFNCPKFYDFSAPTPSLKRKAHFELSSVPKKQKCSPTLAEKVMHFQQGMCHQSGKVSQPASCEKPSLTLPKPFTLLTSERAELKPALTKQTEEYIPLSVQVAKWMRDTPPRLKREPQPCSLRPPERTVLQPFHLETDARAIQHKAVASSKPPPTPTFARFKATPLDRRIFLKEIGVKKVERKPNTVPEEFSLSRREVHRATVTSSDQTFQFKANPVPLGTPFRPTLPHRKVTATPFTLATEMRCSGLRQRSETERSQTMQFKATPWKAEDFIKPLDLHRQPKPLTEIQAFNLHCDRRASERAVWEDERKQKEQAKMEALALREKEREEKEAEELRALRRSMVHRPQPILIKNFKSVRQPVAATSDSSPLDDAADQAPARSPAQSLISSPLLTMR